MIRTEYKEVDPKEKRTKPMPVRKVHITDKGKLGLLPVATWLKMDLKNIDYLVCIVST